MRPKDRLSLKKGLGVEDLAFNNDGHDIKPISQCTLNSDVVITIDIEEGEVPLPVGQAISTLDLRTPPLAIVGTRTKVRNQCVNVVLNPLGEAVVIVFRGDNAGTGLGRYRIHLAL